VAEPHRLISTWERVSYANRRRVAIRLTAPTNAIEALNAQLRRAVRARGHFPSDEAATKLLYLILNRSEKEWRMPPREWSMAKAQFAVLFGERFIKAMAA
jgi:putative transposase